MALPGNTFFDGGTGSEFLVPDNFIPIIPTVDRELGGIALSDPSQGLQVQDWECSWNALTDNIEVYPVGSTTKTAIINAPLVTKVSLAFDANMRPYIAYCSDGVNYFRWYDAAAGDYTTTTFAAERDLCVTHDIKTFELVQSNVTDVLLFYLRGDGVFYRRQRDRYTIEYRIATLSNNLAKLAGVGLSRENRIQLQLEKIEGTTFVSSP